MEHAKIVWRWSALPRQVVEDLRCHWQHRDLPAPLLRRLVEQERLLWSNRIRAIDYYELGLFDPAMAAVSKRSYIGQFRTRHLHVAMNDSRVRQATDDKLQFSRLAAEAGLPVPEILAVVGRELSGMAVATINSADELHRWMTGTAAADIVFKPVGGLKGWGVLSLGARSGAGSGAGSGGAPRWRCLPGDSTMDIAALWAHCSRYLDKGGLLIQRRLQPHADLARIQPDVLHTVRAITYVKPEPRILDAILRIGSGRTPTDNISGGGIAVPIDLATGRCGRGTMVVDGVPRYVDDHPVSGARVTGLLVQDWHQVCALAKAAARTFRAQPTFGWDIGLASEGPVLMEGNWCYGLRANQIANRRGILETPWVEVFNNEGAYRRLGLGFRNRPAGIGYPDRLVGARL